ncbi:acyltransferase [Sulfuriferula sp. AH1]|uniref:acyltransferase family protein n=1 Tax=Sulfuriferula sp. AH1 TaxID=1985873 RepID=UPI000B3BAAAE|nr:acyltransferase family protein [Sulfuriferula sp. AH1]ARU30791.1 acyltransferase [Sulfuriferula sp. AH1]
MHHKHPHLAHPKYRPDIDGLRAVAILSVISFHAFPDIMPGGFIGVDIFFVISGFLISTIIFSSLERDRFSLVEFYIRRIKRIAPALILVLLSSLVAGWFLLVAIEFDQLGKHTLGGVGFVENLVLWRENGYFDNTSETKPLLHLWSLAIEEQFYIFWPLLLAFVWKRQWSFLKLTLLIAVVSFAANIYLMQRHPTAAFYLPVSRFWELMTGGMLAYANLHRPQLIDKFRNAQSALGFTLILSGLLVLNKGRDFPGWWALLPTLGAFFIISAGPAAWLNQKLLSTKPMVWIGLISYPLYLWHWPLLSYLRIVDAEALRYEKLGAIIIAIVLAWLTYWFIEKKIRTAKNASVTALILFLLLLATGLLGAMVYMHQGYPERPINKQSGIPATLELFKESRESDGSCEKFNHEKPVKEEVCLSNSENPQLLFVGDSHVMALYSAIFAKQFPANSMLVAAHACPLYPNLSYTPTFRLPLANNCTEVSQQALSIAKKYKSIKTVIMANLYNYSNHTYNTYRLNGANLSPNSAFIIGNGFFIQQMLSLGKNVVLVEDVPKLHFDPLQCIQRVPFVTPNNCDSSRKENDIQQRTYKEDLSTLKEKYPPLQIFYTEDTFCDSDICLARLNNKWLYIDTNHISIYASNILLNKMKQDGYLK